MKLTTLTLLLATIAPALGCLVIEGTIDMDADTVDYVRVIDNGALVCHAGLGVRTDQDNHYSVGCIPGYIYAVTKDGGFAWFRNHDRAYSFSQAHSQDLSTW